MNSKNLLSGNFLLVLNHICQSRIKVACKVAKSFLTLFPVTLVKVEVQESSLHQMNHKKVYFLTCFMQNVQKLNMVGCRALNDRANHYGPPCKSDKEGPQRSHWITISQFNNIALHNTYFLGPRIDLTLWDDKDK